MKTPATAVCERIYHLALVGLTLAGCGRVDRDPSDMVGGASTTSTAGSAGSGGASSSGAGGEAGAEVLAPTPADIAGRWALFTINDPVGMNLVQTGASLAGEGCAAGTPPLDDGLDVCGPLRGEVEGSSARFHFETKQLGAYGDEVIVSADGQRMTGHLRAVMFNVPWPTAWLRVPDGDPGLLPRPGGFNELSGGYELTLEGSDDAGTEYDGSKSYALRYRSDEGISSDLGSFWHTEIAHAGPGKPIEVGPVPTTAPELAVAMTLETDAESITQLRATTGSGHTYRFKVSRLP